jgi:hypothetical protein
MIPQSLFQYISTVLYLASNWVKKSHVFWGAKGVEEPELTWEGLWSPLRLPLVQSKPV